MKNIGASIVTLPFEAPVMALPNAVLLPNTLLPLHIFEPRYRAMLTHCLERERMFCIVMMKPGVTEAINAAQLYHIAGIGLVRACVGGADGTSNLVLQGLARVELTDFVQEKPFRIARVRELRSELFNLVEAEALAAKVVELCENLKARGLELSSGLQRKLPHISHPDALADIVAGAFLRDANQRQEILEERVVADRLRLLIRCLNAIAE